MFLMTKLKRIQRTHLLSDLYNNLVKNNFDSVIVEILKRCLWWPNSKKI